MPTGPVNAKVTPTPKPGESEQIQALKRKYRDDGLERLVKANPDYYNSHGYYLPELATLLLAERAERVALLTQQSQDRAEPSTAWPEDANETQIECLRLRAELDRAVEREARVDSACEALSDEDAAFIRAALAASPGKGAEGEAGNG